MAIYRRNPTHLSGHIVICLIAIVFMGCLDIYTTYIEEGDYEHFMSERRKERLILADAAVTLRVRRIEHFKPIYLNRLIRNERGDCATISGITSLLSIKRVVAYFQLSSSHFNRLLENEGDIWDEEYKILKKYADNIKTFFNPAIASKDLDLQHLCSAFQRDLNESLLQELKEADFEFKDKIDTIEAGVEDVMVIGQFGLHATHHFIYLLVQRMYTVRFGMSVGSILFEKNFPWYYPKAAGFEPREEKAVILKDNLSFKDTRSYLKSNYELRTMFLHVEYGFSDVSYYQWLRDQIPDGSQLTATRINPYSYHCIAVVRSRDGKSWIAREDDVKARRYGENPENAILDEMKFLRKRQRERREAIRKLYSEQFPKDWRAHSRYIKERMDKIPMRIIRSGPFIGSPIDDSMDWAGEWNEPR